jgi:hypothetical protein
MAQVSNSTSDGHVVSDRSKPYFPAWGLALFALFGVVAITLIFCVHCRGGRKRSSKERDRETDVGSPHTTQRDVNALNDSAKEGP